MEYCLFVLGLCRASVQVNDVLHTFFVLYTPDGAAWDFTTMKRKTIYFNSRDELLRIDLSSVVYFEADGNYTKLVSANNLSSMICMNLGKMEELLALRFKDAPGTFARIGKRYIVNLQYVYGINTLKQELILSDQTTFSTTLSISKVALKGLKELISPTPVTLNRE